MAHQQQGATMASPRRHEKRLSPITVSPIPSATKQGYDQSAAQSRGKFNRRLSKRPE